MRFLSLALSASTLLLGLASATVFGTEEKKSMNVKRITPVLLVKEIEPIVPFWVDRLGFTGFRQPANEAGMHRGQLLAPLQRRPFHAG